MLSPKKPFLLPLVITLAFTNLFISQVDSILLEKDAACLKLCGYISTVDIPTSGELQYRALLDPEQAGAQAGQSAGSTIGNVFGTNLGQAFGQGLGSALGNIVGLGPLGGQIGSQILSQLGGSFGSQILGQSGSLLGGAVGQWVNGLFVPQRQGRSLRGRRQRGGGRNYYLRTRYGR